MSTDAHAGHHEAGHHHAGHDEHAQSHGSFRGYMTGFVLSVILTAIPFWLVMTGVIESKQVTAFAVMALAITQIFVHMVYFLHMDGRSEGGWSMMALVFTLILVVIALAGSLWVMYHLNTNMMPVHEMRQIP